MAPRFIAPSVVAVLQDLVLDKEASQTSQVERENLMSLFLLNTKARIFSQPKILVVITQKSFYWGSEI